MVSLCCGLPAGGQHSPLAREPGSEPRDQRLGPASRRRTAQTHLKASKRKDQPQRLGVKGIKIDVCWFSMPFWLSEYQERWGLGCFVLFSGGYFEKKRVIQALVCDSPRVVAVQWHLFSTRDLFTANCCPAHQCYSVQVPRVLLLRGAASANRVYGMPFSCRTA